ncbi:hypothetical protein AB4144_44830, partial [Rhizobiaceae sp. 2RAB30]
MSQIIKVVMAMRHGTIPGTRLHRRLVEDAALRSGAVNILRDNTFLEDLSSGRPFLAGVHAYGLGGCNAHIVLGEGPRAEEERNGGPLPFLLSGNDEAELIGSAESLLQWLQRSPSASLSDICFTLAAGRSHKRRRAAFLCKSKDEFAAWLGSLVYGLDQMRSEVAPTAAIEGIHATMSRWLGG